MQSKEDDDMTNLLSPGVKLVSNLVTRIEQDLKKTFGKLILTCSPVNTATWCIFGRDCTWTSFQMSSRSVETCIRGCQNYSFSNTQDILTGSLLEQEQDGEPIFVARRRNMLRQRPDRWQMEKSSMTRGASMFTAKVHVFSDSVRCTGPGALDSAYKYLETEGRSSREK